ncbi:hypothetical protein JCGZ_15215 [Jatropha curcas]|uniref:Uncharacterized protein n=1 Tax=Jatropha curcas TaxID=180498 RepID=A0A067KIK8_JATCU|nr:hypothetical protein JCGZ_15215 [Jatropha curcas]
MSLNPLCTMVQYPISKPLVKYGIKNAGAKSLSRSPYTRTTPIHQDRDNLQYLRTAFSMPCCLSTTTTRPALPTDWLPAELNAGPLEVEGSCNLSLGSPELSQSVEGEEKDAFNRAFKK